MDDLDAGVIVAVVPQLLGSLTDATPIHVPIRSMDELLHDLAHGHCKMSAQRIDYTEVVLGNDVLASSEWAEVDYVVE